MGLPELKTEQKYTYRDYASWPEDERWELIAGIPYAMTAPLRIHQKIVTKLSYQIESHLESKPSSCEVYVAPFNVRLPRADEHDDDVDTTVEPDISVICDQSKLDRKGCRGTPDWIIEVLSSSTTLHDMHTKRGLYEKHGVQEYWIIHPEEHWIMVYLRDEAGQYGKPAMYGMDEATPVVMFPELLIDWTFLVGEVENEASTPASAPATSAQL